VGINSGIYASLAKAGEIRVLAINANTPNLIINLRNILSLYIFGTLETL
jgi:hypothetical protein